MDSTKRGSSSRPKSGDAFRQQHVVDAILQVRVLAAHVQVTVHRRILRHARRAQDDLVERRVGALRQGHDLFLGEGVGGRPRSGKIWSRAWSSWPMTVMLPNWVTLVELPGLMAVAAATVLVWAKAVPPPASATDEMTAQ